MGADIVITLPLRFWQDHQERDLPAGEVIRESKRTVVISCDEATLAEIESDARHYAHVNGPDAEGLGGLKASARATVIAIESYRRTLP